MGNHGKVASVFYDSANLPTHLARVVGRAALAGPDASGDTFLMTSYVVEALLKTITITLCAAINRSSPSAAYKFKYDLVRADGLGNWEAVVGVCTTQSFAGYIHGDIQPLLGWLTKKRTRSEDEWAREAATNCQKILSLLGVPDEDLPSKLNVRHVLSQFVRIRNKTKAHGAVGIDFFQQANPHYIEATHLLLKHCPVVEWDWFFLAERPSKKNVKAIALRGPAPVHVRAAEAEALRPRNSGIYFRTHERGQLFDCGDMMHTTPECASFWVPNGGMTAEGLAEYLDYSNGSVRQVDVSSYLAPPAPLPPSETEGTPVLEIYSNVFGNLPPSPSWYVQRPKLEDELLRRLVDRNHPIITLHGRGGIGKTSLALFVAHQMANRKSVVFDHIIWLSARDLELKPSGPTEVRRAIPNLDKVCEMLGGFLDIESEVDAFATVLQNPEIISSSGLLLIFDNFETFDDPRGLHKFLDTHTHIPNKVLITSRERAFKADFPIEVGGMEFEEAKELLKREARNLQIEGIVTDSVIEDIHAYTDGHAYVMRVLLGEIAKDRRWVQPKSLVPRRGDLLNAIFERSFNKLTPEGRRVFLIIGNWRSAVFELSLIVLPGMREFDVEGGLDECLRLSLLTRHELADGHFCYSAPELARAFAKKKLEGDPDRLLINEDLQLARQFGPLKVDHVCGSRMDEMVQDFLTHVFDKIDEMNSEAKLKIDDVVIRIAEMWPYAWPQVARIRQRTKRPAEEVAYALRRAVEEMPYDKNVWIARAEHAQGMHDETTRIASLVSAVEADPSDVELIREVALQLCKYIDGRKSEIPQARRGVYIASVRSHMQKVAASLDPTGLSRLAWLFLLEGDTDKAWEYANMGLAKDSTNSHCLNIVQRIEAPRNVD